MKQIFKKQLGLLGVYICLMGNITLAQTDDSSKEESQQQTPIGIQFSEPIESEWEFGVEINCAGNGKLVTVVSPIPMDFPEQDIEILNESKSENVGKLTHKNATKNARQFSFGINQMQAGQSASAVVKIKVKKRLIKAPADKTQFSIPKKIPSAVKAFLKPSPLIESKDKRIKAIAKTLIDDVDSDDTKTDWDLAENNYKWVRQNVKYKFDVTNRSCLHALENKIGDCGELSSLFVAICRAQKIPARVVWVPGHAYAEFYLHDKEGHGHWFPCQPAGEYEFGSMSDARPVIHKGDRFKMPGQRNETAFLRPTLSAKSGAGLSIEKWIARPVLKNN